MDVTDRNRSVRAVYFSPTGTTRAVVMAAAEGTGLSDIRYSDITTAELRSEFIPKVSEDLLIIGMPVYEEHIPKIAAECLFLLQAHGRPVLIISVYGNVGYGMSLKDLEGICVTSGACVYAAGAFIGEHSFSSGSIAPGAGRPSDIDLAEARELGGVFIQKAAAGSGAGLDSSLIPGRLPLTARILPEGSASMFTKPPVINRLCNSCGICRKVCPAGAVREDFSIDEALCLRCFACVKKCRRSARAVEYRKSFLVKTMLRMNSRHKSNLLIV